MTSNPIIQWNCRGFRANHAELQHLTASLNPVVTCLQETQLAPGTKTSLKGFVTYSNYGPNVHRPSGGTSILVRNNIPHSQVIINTRLQVTAVQVSNIISRTITICTIYVPPEFNLTLQDLDSLAEQLPTPYMLLGDFNSHNPIWGSQYANTKGKILENFINSNDLCLLNTPAHTHLHSGHGTYTTIDLTLCEPELLLEFSWKVWDDLCGSDHFPIVITPERPHWSEKTRYWKLSKADWPSFQLHCRERLSTAPTQSSDLNEWFTNTLRVIAEETIPKSSTKPRKHRNPWYNEECKQAIKARKRTERIFYKHPTWENLIDLKLNRARARRVINTAKKQSWRNYTSKITKNTPITKVWDLLRKMKGRGDRPRILYVKHEDGMATEEKDIAEQLAKAFERNSTGSDSIPAFQIIRSREERKEINFHLNNTDPYNQEFNLEELVTSLKQSHDTATGPDDIHYQMLKHLPTSSLILLLEVFNQIWTSGKLPSTWKEATIIPLPKPGKEHSDPNNYRPIALTSCLCKTMERMVNNRLVWQLEKNHIISELQSGFRKGRSTTDNLVRLDTFIRDAFIRKEHAVVVFFDLEKAYDTTWRFGILKDLHQAGLRGRLPMFVADFLTNRHFKVKVNNTFSERHIQEMGVPQGSILSVTLFNLKINSVTKVIPPGIFCSLYVDDLSIGYRGRHMHTVERQLQLGINKVHQWSVTNGFKFSKSKTTCVHFCKLRSAHPEPELHLQGDPIKVEKETKFLGLTLDSKLSFIPHIRNIKKECMKRLTIIKVLTRTKWGAEFHPLIQLYRTIVRTKLDYGSIIYGAARKSYLNSLNTVHHQGIRLALGAYRTSPIQSLYVEAREPCLEHRRLSLVLQYVVKLKANQRNSAYTSTFSPSYTALYDAKPTHIQPLGLRIRQQLRELEVDLTDIAQMPYHSVPPWTLKKPSILLDLASGKKSDTHPNIYLQQFMDVKEKFPSHLFIYTDGSKTENKVSAAMVAGEQELRVDLLQHCSIFTAEAYALLMAVDHVTTTRQQKSMICSDSKSCLQALDNLNTGHPLIVTILNRLHNLSNENINIKFCWIPGHSGFTGNEKADQVARRTSQAEKANCKLPPTDIKPLIHNYIKEKWQDEWNNQTNSKLYELNPKIDHITNTYIDNRWDQVIYSRCRIGHTRLTHSFLLKGERPPHCDVCQQTVTIKHVLTECPKYLPTKQKLCLSDTLMDIFNKDNANKVLNFLTITKLRVHI